MTNTTTIQLKTTEPTTEPRLAINDNALAELDNSMGDRRACR